jgi:RNA polymerase sigma factor (sigma-70 family)
VPAEPSPDNQPLQSVKSANDKNNEPETKDRKALIPQPDMDDETGEDNVDIDDALTKIVENTLAGQDENPVDCGYSIELLKQHDATAWEKAAEQFLQIAAYIGKNARFMDLPGADENEIKSAGGVVILKLRKDIEKYASVPQLKAAFRTALHRDILSLIRAHQTKTRGGKITDVTADFHGLNFNKDVVGQHAYAADDASSASSLENKRDLKAFDWNAFKSPTASEILDQKEKREIISRAIKLLKPKEQKLFTLFYTERLNNKEIANELNIGISSVSGRIKRVVQKVVALGRNELLMKEKMK